MAQLAIKGHATRGSEVIALLEMLGGRNPIMRDGTNTDFYYSIDKKGVIQWVCNDYNHYFGVTLEQFLEKFPYKVGDVVSVRDNNLNATVSETITNMRWDKDSNCIFYDASAYHNLRAEELRPYTVQKEETMKGYTIKAEDIKSSKTKITSQEASIIFDQFTTLNKVELILGENFEVRQEGGKWIVVKKKPQYPKTFVEVLDYWHPNRQLEDDYQSIYKKNLIEKFQDLLYARDAYWKIAGNWKPDWNNIQDKHCIYVVSGELWLKECQTRQCTLAFPTAEMRDTFYENFKDLIETCKELL